MRRLHSAAGTSNTTAMHGTPAAAADCLQSARSVAVETERVDHCRQSSTQATGDDLIEHRERIGRGAQVVLVLADNGAKRIAGHDLIRREVRSGPRRLSRGDRTDQHNEARRRNAQGYLGGRGDRPRLLRSGCAGSGRDEFATIDFGTKYVVAQPESDTANGVDETQLGCPQLQLAAQVRQVNVDHVRVADPVRAPHFFEQLRAAQTSEGRRHSCSNSANSMRVTGMSCVANADLLATDIDGQWTEA